MLTQERLKHLLHYNPITGKFIRLVKTNYNITIGLEAGGITDKGYIKIRVDSKKYAAHRLAWLYMNGKFPENHIDHIDSNKSNNAISNLREANSAQNMQHRGLLRHNTSGAKGVCWDKQHNKYRVRISCNNRKIHIGRYSGFEEAKKEYEKAVSKYHGDFAGLSCGAY
jgi:hypothetical protein